jgi:hypothetical protein
MFQQQVVPGTTATDQYKDRAAVRKVGAAEALNTRDDFGAGFTSAQAQLQEMGLGGYNIRPALISEEGKPPLISISERGGGSTERLNPRYRLEKDPEATVQRQAIKSAIGKMEDDAATSFLRDFADAYVAAKGTQRFEGRA